MKNNRGLEMSFSFLFGIIIGIIILGFAIYGVIRIIDTSENVQTAKTSTEIGILLNPLETGFQNSASTSFSMPVDTRINFACDNLIGNFGRQLISVEQKNLGKWTETDLEVSFPNKYIFSENNIQGKEFYIFSKPFEFPFKVTDLFYITSSERNYCFTGQDNDIRDELENLNQENLFLKEEEFPEECVSVCFEPDGCDIEITFVDPKEGYVKKAEQRMYFTGDALMFAAIFSSKTEYECGLDRLMMRAKELANLYEYKSGLIATKNCESNINLIGLGANFANYNQSSDLFNLYPIIRDIEEENARAKCKLW